MRYNYKPVHEYGQALFFLLYSNNLRDIAQLVARLLWEQDVTGSNPAIPIN